MVDEKRLKAIRAIEQDSRHNQHQDNCREDGNLKEIHVFPISAGDPNRLFEMANPPS